MDNSRCGSDVLIIAGDTCEKSARGESYIKEFFRFCSDNYKLVIEVPGNHDMWYTDYSNNHEPFKEYVHPNYIYTTENCVEFENVTFVCSIFWSHIPTELSSSVNTFMVDYRVMDGFTCEQSNRIHSKSIEYIDDICTKICDESTDRHIVVITHHSPTLKGISPRYYGSTINCAFASDVDWLINKHPIKYWVYGHSHDFNELNIGDTIVVRNPLGYISNHGRETVAMDYSFELN